VSQPSGSPVPYRVVYSERVRAELKELLARAVAKGLGPQALHAVKEIDARLRVYPQFGEARRDLQTQGETLWQATVPPLFVEYIIDEANRSVFVVFPFRALPRCGL
jgi:hypothetical protein